MKAVVLVSGGIDSTTALWMAVKEYGYEVTPVFYKYGQRHMREYRCVVGQCQRLDVLPKSYTIDIPFLKSALTNTEIPIPTIHEVLHDRQPITYVPFRNTILLSLSCALAEGIEAGRVIFGAQLRDLYGYYDTTSEFLLQFNKLITMNRKHQITVEAPLIQMSKAEVVKRAVALGVDLSDTYSCYAGGSLHCNKCPTCAERRRAFIDAGIPDPTEYAGAPV